MFVIYFPGIFWAAESESGVEFLRSLFRMHYLEFTEFKKFSTSNLYSVMQKTPENNFSKNTIIIIVSYQYRKYCISYDFTGDKKKTKFIIKIQKFCYKSEKYFRVYYYVKNGLLDFSSRLVKYVILYIYDILL